MYRGTNPTWTFYLHGVKANQISDGYIYFIYNSDGEDARPKVRITSDMIDTVNDTITLKWSEAQSLALRDSDIINCQLKLQLYKATGVSTHEVVASRVFQVETEDILGEDTLEE